MPRPVLMNIPPSGHAIMLINPPAMEELAYKLVYGKIIPVAVRRPFMWVVAYLAKTGEHMPAMKLLEVVMEANDVTPPTARRHIRDARGFGLIDFYQEKGSRRYLPQQPGEPNKQKRLCKLLAQIREVAAIQLTKPEDHLAGIELFDEADRAVYYNIVAQIKGVEHET